MLQNVKHIANNHGIFHFINIIPITNILLINLALLLVVNCKFDIKIYRTLCNKMTQLFYMYIYILYIYIVTSNNLVFYYHFIHKHFVDKRINL